MVAGGNSGVSGNIRTGETYTSNQYSQVQVTSTQLSGGQWIGPAVRSQGNGQNLYLGIYFWNSGSPQLRLYERTSGKLGAARLLYPTGRAGRRDDPRADRHWLHDIFLLNATPGHHRHRHQPDRRRSRHRGVRDRQGR